MHLYVGDMNENRNVKKVCRNIFDKKISKTFLSGSNVFISLLARICTVSTALINYITQCP